MGNKNVTPESWVRDVMDERRSKIWGKDGQEKKDYPNFWPKPQDQPTNTSISTVEFGKVFQYPIIRPTNIEKDFNQLPKLNYANVDSPTPRMMAILKQIDGLSLVWQNSIQQKNIYSIVAPVLTLLLGPSGDDVRSFLTKNLKEQLNFFGLIDYPGVGNRWFEKKISQFPGNYELPIYIMLLLYVDQHFHNDNAPFLKWKRNSAVDDSIYPIPSLVDFIGQMDGLRVTHGNFWLEMNPYLKTKEDILLFWQQNPKIIEFVLDFRKSLVLGTISFGFIDGRLITSTDGHTDNYDVKMSFFDIFKFKKDNKPFFNFPYWNELITEKYTNTATLNCFIRNYGYLMVKDVERILPDIWERRESIKWPTIPWSPIADLDRSFLERDFMVYKTRWQETAMWYFFESNRPEWPPRLGINPNDPNEFRVKMWAFIINYPIPALKVPPYSFADWSRFSRGWKEIFELQWEAYFVWATENIFASSRPNYVNPGEQLKNTEGELLFYKNEQGQLVPLINTFPDFGIMREGGGGPIGRDFRFLFAWSIVGDWVWGDGFWEFFNGTIKKVFKLVLDALRALYEFVSGILPSLLLLFGVGVGAYYLLKDKKETGQVEEEK